MDDIIGLVAVLCVFGIPLTAIWTHHKRQVMEMQMRMRNEGDSSVRALVEALREEVRALRDTTTQYDLSFDSALQRMEHRVEGLERRVGEVEANRTQDVRVGH